MGYSRQHRKKHTQFTIIASLLTLLLIVTGCGLGFKIVHDTQLRKKEAIAYQKLKKSAISAEKVAYQNLAAENLQHANELVAKLKKADQAPIKKKLARLNTYFSHIEAAKKAVDSYRSDQSSKSMTAAESVITQLTSHYEKGQKEHLLKQMETIKKQIAAQQAAKEAAAFKNKKLIALTFDDGPNPATTPLLLQELKAANIHATFFCIGYEAKANPGLIKEEAAAGEEVGTHTWDHPELTTLSPAAQKKEIMSAHDLVNSISGQNTNIYRPPYGAYDDQTIAAAPSLTPILWSIDSSDWRDVNNAPQVVQNVVSKARDGGVVLLHDSHAWSVAAVPSIVSQLKAQGFTFVTVSEMMAARPKWYVHSGKVYAGY